MWVDDGVSSRGHRTKLFNAEFKTVGTACGPHQKYKDMCVLDCAGEMSAKTKWYKEKKLKNILLLFVKNYKFNLFLQLINSQIICYLIF